MSYLNRDLSICVKGKTRLSRKHWYVSVLRGINEITLKPSRPNIVVGDLGDDWRAVGNDMRRAMRQLRPVD
jgi:hypothetical protein